MCYFVLNYFVTFSDKLLSTPYWCDSRTQLTHLVSGFVSVHDMYDLMHRVRGRHNDMFI